MNTLKLYSSPLKYLDNSEGQRCHYPLRYDPYLGCSHDCCYCFSKSLNERYKNVTNFGIDIKKANLENFSSMLYNIFTKKKVSCSTEAKFLSRKLPLRIGANTDPFQNLELQEKITYNLIKLLNQYDYPYIITTKSDLIATKEYLDILRPDLAYIQISITTLDPILSKQLEPGAPIPKSRLLALKQLSNYGFITAARISPIIPIYPDGYFTLNKDTNFNSKPCNYFSFDLVNEICKTSPKTILAEFLRISPSISQNLNAIDFSLDSFYTKKTNQGYKHFSLNEKKYYFDKIKKICSNYNIQFTVCDDIHFTELQEFWNTESDCCNICNNIPSFKTKYQL